MQVFIPRVNEFYCKTNRTREAELVSGDQRSLWLGTLLCSFLTLVHTYSWEVESNFIHHRILGTCLHLMSTSNYTSIKFGFINSYTTDLKEKYDHNINCNFWEVTWISQVLKCKRLLFFFNCNRIPLIYLFILFVPFSAVQCSRMNDLSFQNLLHFFLFLNFTQNSKFNSKDLIVWFQQFWHATSVYGLSPSVCFI